MRGAVSLAQKLNVSTLIIAITVVAFGTSLPELIVSLEAALSGSPSIAIGNVVGSNIANILLVLGLPAIIAPIAVKNTGLRRDAIMVVIASLILTFFSVNGYIDSWQGLILFALLILFLGYTYVLGKRDQRKALVMEAGVDTINASEQNYWKIAVSIIGGLVGLYIGSKLLIQGATGIALSYNVPKEVIGLTLVAFGTSLPELTTSLIAVLRKESDFIIGNVLGSNIFNTFGVAGITSAIIPIPVSEKLLSFDFIIMIGCVILLLPFIFFKIKIKIVFGLLFLSTYMIYVWSQFTGMSGISIG